MYSFQPVKDYSDVHVGFYIICGIVAVIMFILLALWKEDEVEPTTLMIWTTILGIVLFVAHDNSYTPHHPLNEQHIGHFVGYSSEGYSERSGKTTAEHHLIYVIYNIDGYNVLFQASTGMAYPKQAVVYKN